MALRMEALGYRPGAECLPLLREEVDKKEAGGLKSS